MSRIITMNDLHGRSLAELHVLHHELQQALAGTAPGTDAQRQALASLEAIRRMIRLRQQALSPRF
ncbi:hypothetical protein PZ895_14445 [Mesorhizobium sp. YIM 152430]|uniref:hypothetical protein n=1 Tax=Mesorhizobium sp. YIM 152430 TaxID=3031761 RepID=UPI0023D9C648|nr:hypothetical protein [Mesorhizobium sp. YIM 152430]MDF1600959.1 hypothetical protein [Mesorhizobium sp. YIM 152430]